MRRIVLCSGKIYVDAAGSEWRDKNTSTAIVRVEQLYPFPGDELRDVLKAYRHLQELVWLQEEPENMGAWQFVQPRLAELARLPVRYIGRPANSSPAEGSAARYAADQKKLIERALTIGANDPS